MYGPSSSSGTDDQGGRGQSYVLEAIGAAIVVITAVVFALQATAVTPLSVSTASKHVENQERATARTLLDQADHNGTLRAAILYWNPENRTFYGATANGYVGRTPENAFGNQLERVFLDEQIAVNVRLNYREAGGGRGARQLVYQGTPSNNAVSASHAVVLMDDDRLTAPGYTGRVVNSTRLVPQSAQLEGPVYTVVEVRIVAWRM